MKKGIKNNKNRKDSRFKNRSISRNRLKIENLNPCQRYSSNLINPFGMNEFFEAVSAGRLAQKLSN